MADVVGNILGDNEDWTKIAWKDIEGRRWEQMIPISTLSWQKEVIISQGGHMI